MCGRAVKTLAKLVLAQACLSLCYLPMCYIPKSHELAHLLLELILVTLIKLQCHPEVDGGVFFLKLYLSHNMRFPTMWYVQPAKGSNLSAHMLSLIRAFASRLNIL